MSPPPKSLALPVISRIKVIADLNIAEHRVPQDGRIKMTIEGRAVDLRVSTFPTQFGESVVLRVLDKSAVNLDLDNLGLPENVKQEFETQFVAQMEFLLLLDQPVQEKQPPFTVLFERLIIWIPSY